MENKYIISTEGFKNIYQDGSCIGYKLGIRIPYYRGVSLALIDYISIKVNGEEAPESAILFTAGGETFTLAEMKTVVRYRWEMNEIATLTVIKPGGLRKGEHLVDVKVALHVSYMPKGSFSYDQKRLVMDS